LETSDATVVRTAQALGFDGLAELKQLLAETLSGATPSKAFNKVVGEAKADTRKAIERSLDMPARAVADLRQSAAADDIAAAAHLLGERRRIVLFGQGQTAHIIAYMGHLLRRHGRDVLLLRASGTALADELLQLRPDDGLLLLSYDRIYSEARAATNEALRLAIPIVLITGNARSELAQKCDQMIVLPRGEIGGMATYGATLVWLEALIVALAVASKQETSKTLLRLEQIRRDLN
ncbi:SIS domain-containing protein, partial [Devosia sp.]|uniref:MurR/RpiR family transcriptional regulator n=1 Tax=Devosia sp. TaxID=1871048 RepID=UPI001AC944E5